jgi:hypothetical protein
MLTNIPNSSFFSDSNIKTFEKFMSYIHRVTNLKELILDNANINDKIIEILS